ncbi:MAG: hypothetical protein ACKPEZ_19025, partial [Planktothrix sp.]
LDCCYSGAFAEGWQNKNVEIDFKNQLGAEGRVVLTSSTATQTSFQQEGEELSLYTTYLVEGIETGAADEDGDGNIHIRELHCYAKAKVQKVKPQQKPEIIIDKEGFNIVLSLAPARKLIKNIDTQLIVNIDQFINAYNKRAATPIDTNFHCRQKELNQVLTGLEEKNLVLIYGKAGVGKSRLALECCKHFLISHPEYQVKCILNRSVNIFDDIHASFLKSNCLLIFVDDVDRVTSFDYFIDLLYDQGENQKLKVIGTVRDYAYEKVNKFTHFYKNKIEIEIPSLQDQEIQEIICNNYQIFNHLYLDRIT